MASKVEICNQALLKLGQPAIMSLDDDSPRARQCFQEFEAALGATLRSYPWPFAIVRKELARRTEKPPFGFAYYYELPEDVARIVDMYTGNFAYNIEGRYVATNSEYVAMRYVSKKVPVEQLDEQTVEVVSLALAARLAIIITENAQLKDMLYMEHERALAQARNTWAVEDHPQEVIEGNWLAAHDAGPGGDFARTTWNPWGPDGTGVKR